MKASRRPEIDARAATHRTARDAPTLMPSEIAWLQKRRREEDAAKESRRKMAQVAMERDPRDPSGRPR